jgi:perosamine synthetase
MKPPAIRAETVPLPPRMLPYGRQTIEEDDIESVVKVLRSDWLTTGPMVEEFEHAFAEATGASHAVAVSNGTAALHASMAALGITSQHEVIVPAITFVASANCVVYQGGTPVFADVEPDTLLIDPVDVERKITARTRAIVAVDYAGQPCNYDALRGIAAKHGLALVADACHALGGSDHGRPVGSLADVSTFSLHPVKPITSGEGGVVVTDDANLATRLRVFRNHGITTDFRQRETQGAFYYEMTELGYNYRLSDIHCALALSQLRKLPAWVKRRQEIAAQYDAAFAGVTAIRPLVVRPGVSHGYHLYVIRLDGGLDRTACFRALRAAGIGVNVHYSPVHLHPFYRTHFQTGPGLCPVAEASAQHLLSLPIFPAMTDSDVERVVDAVQNITTAGDYAQ